MTKKILFVLICCSCLMACATNKHIIGNGPQKGEEVSARQWYVLYGLIPINQIDSKEMAGDSTNYEIITRQGFGDIFINIFTSPISITSRTVTVKK